MSLTKPERFGRYIKRLRKEAKLTIRELEEKSGVSNAYLSQIENGKRGLPTPEILMKLHKPLKINYGELMERAGYISHSVRSELTPETIEVIGGNGDLAELIANATKIFIRSVTNADGRLKDDFKDLFIHRAALIYPADKENLDAIVNSPDFIRSLFEHLTLEEKISFLNIMVNDFVDRGKNWSDIFVSDHATPVIKAPLLGSIAAGQPILATENIEEWVEIPNTCRLKEGEVIVLKVKGDSMIGSRIYEGDKVVIKLQQDVENGEIAVVNVNGDEATLKRVKKTENGQVILYPDNPKYEPIFINNENARIVGKVVQVIFEPR